VLGDLLVPVFEHAEVRLRVADVDHEKHRRRIISVFGPKEH
jgi:hypothetical protein